VVGCFSKCRYKHQPEANATAHPNQSQPTPTHPNQPQPTPTNPQPTRPHQVKGDLWTTAAFIDAVRLPYIAPSLGGVESLIEQPTVISYWDQVWGAVGVTGGLGGYGGWGLWAGCEQSFLVPVAADTSSTPTNQLPCPPSPPHPPTPTPTHPHAHQTPRAPTSAPRSASRTTWCASVWGWRPLRTSGRTLSRRLIRSEI